MKTGTFKIDTTQSKIDWIGRKVTGAHNGTIAIAAGALLLRDGKLTGGQFTIDTTSIKILDVTDPATNAQFAGHLASDDFFSTEKFQKATLDITSVVAQTDTRYHIRGNLTIKGITHPAHFDATVTTQGDTVNAAAKLVVDRTLYDMKFRSGNFFKDLGDNLIYNDFDLNIRLIATAA